MSNGCFDVSVYVFDRTLTSWGKQSTGNWADPWIILTKKIVDLLINEFSSIVGVEI